MNKESNRNTKTAEQLRQIEHIQIEQQDKMGSS